MSPDHTWRAVFIHLTGVWVSTNCIRIHTQAMSQRQAIEDFIAAGTSLLNLQASSSEEIGRAGQEARRLVAQLGDVSQVCVCVLMCDAWCGFVCGTMGVGGEEARRLVYRSATCLRCVWCVVAWCML